MYKPLLTVFVLLIPAIANAQSLIVFKQQNGSHIAFYIPAKGTPIVLSSVTVIDLTTNPTTPPASKTATTAMLLIESGAQTQKIAAMIAGIRNNQALSRKLTILDPDTEDENGNPDPQVKAALSLVRDASLPVVVGFARGKPVAFESLGPTASVATVESILKKWGL